MIGWGQQQKLTALTLTACRGVRGFRKPSLRETAKLDFVCCISAILTFVAVVHTMPFVCLAGVLREHIGAQELHLARRSRCVMNKTFCVP